MKTAHLALLFFVAASVLLTLSSPSRCSFAVFRQIDVHSHGRRAGCDGAVGLIRSMQQRSRQRAVDDSGTRRSGRQSNQRNEHIHGPSAAKRAGRQKKDCESCPSVVSFHSSLSLPCIRQAEMIEASTIVKQANENALVIIDELGQHTLEAQYAHATAAGLLKSTFQTNVGVDFFSPARFPFLSTFSFPLFVASSFAGSLLLCF